MVAAVPGGVGAEAAAGTRTPEAFEPAVNPSEVFIKRPIATSLLMAAIALFGIVAYRALPVSDLPTVDFPTIQVQAGLPGGDPGTMASAVASPLERQFTTIAGVDSMISSSSTGSSNVTLQFDLARRIDSAAVDVQTAIAEVMPLLPAGMPTPPTFRKQNPADQGILYLGLTSNTVPMSVLDDYAETVIAPRISMVDGVSQVQVMGAQKYAVRVQVDPAKLQAQQIGINEVDQALQNWNVNLPTGQLFGPAQTFNIKAAGQLNNAEQFRPIIITYRQGAPIRLEQVANVLDSVEDTRNISWFYTREGGQRAINMQVQRQPGTNTIEVTDAVRRLLPVFESQLPPSVHLAVRGDRSKTIRAAFQDIQWTLLITLVLVVTVIFLFLHNGSATLIPALALPFSILGTFAVMQLLNFSLNNLSMMALILSTGFVVDDAIVMLENIVRHIENGETPFEAALKGSKEIGFTIVTMTASLAAVFIPILFMGGILGRLFREFAVTITAAVLISGVVSITLTPMLCSRFLRVVHTKKGFAGLMDRAFDALFAGYKWSLGIVLRHRLAMLVVFVAVLAATVKMYSIVPKGFIPDQDNDSMNIQLRAAQGTSFYEMATATQRVAEIVRKNPYIDSFMATTGGGGNGFNNAMNTARLMVNLVPRRQRPVSAQQIAQELRPQLLRFPGFRAFVQLPSSLQIGGRVGSSSYNVTVQSLNTIDLYNWAQRLSSAMERIPEIQDVSNDLEMKSPRIDLVIDRDKAAALSLNATQIENALSTGYGPKWSSTIYGNAAQYRVLVELDPKSQEYAGFSGGSDIQDFAWRPGTASVGGVPQGDGGPADDQPLRPASSGLDFVRTASGRLARGRSGRNPHGRRRALTANGDDCVRGIGESVPAVDGQPRPAAIRRHRRRVHRAWRALRKLYPPPHHSVRSAIGRTRCPGHAVVVRKRAEHLLVCRPDHADRDREEERDHADRLCARCRASARQDTGGSDSRGMPDSFPSDHDDNDGRTPGCGADRARLRCRRGGASAAGPCGRGRPDRLPTPDAVSHARGLYVLGDVVQNAQDSDNSAGAS